MRVVEDGGLRTLYTGAGRARQSVVRPGDPRHLALPYTRVATIGLALVAPDAHILYVGLGGGAMPMHARSVLPRASIDVVELDPLIIEVAQQVFATPATSSRRARPSPRPYRSWRARRATARRPPRNSASRRRRPGGT